MRSLENRLKELEIELPSPPPLLGNYLGTKRSGDHLLFLSGSKSDLIGAVGRNASENEADRTARQTVIMMLSIIKADICDSPTGLDSATKTTLTTHFLCGID